MDFGVREAGTASTTRPSGRYRTTASRTGTIARRRQDRRDDQGWRFDISVGGSELIVFDDAPAAFTVQPGETRPVAEVLAEANPIFVRWHEAETN